TKAYYDAVLFVYKIPVFGLHLPSASNSQQNRAPKMANTQYTTPFIFKLLLISLCFSSSALEVIGKENGLPWKKLFVFGDSYSDTGNWKKGTGSAWNPPYGYTFPGKPAGRFSDGRIITDFIASYLCIGSPLPYEQRKWLGAARRLRFGMNFAYGGTGVFDTNNPGPNMTTQIDSFRNLLEASRAYTKHDLESSIALVTLGGNDYAHYLKVGSLEDIQEFTRSVVKQLASDLKRIHGLGVKKIVVTGLQPLGCLPAISSFLSYLKCSDGINAIARYYNQVLKQAVEELNKQKGESSTFLVIDLYGAFMFGLNSGKHQINGTMEYGNALKPCCQGVTNDYTCGSREGKEAKYRVCPNPKVAFFWDSVHPTQNGWFQVFLFIRPCLKAFLSIA
ncbi:hypothetical protein V2J09_001257, partial [Rumex salicifolius]